jgi:hypothetical protein
MIDENKIKDLIENAYLQQKQMVETNYIYFKNMIENAYLQQKQMVETNTLNIENYIRTFGNNDLTKNIENAKGYYYNLTEQSKKRMLDNLDQIRNDFLSNAFKIKNDYENGLNIFKSGDRLKDDSGKTNT